MKELETYSIREIKWAMGLLFVLNLLMLLLVANDFKLVRSSGMLAAVLAARGLFFVFCGVFTAVTYLRPRTPWYPLLLRLETAALVLLLVVVGLSRDRAAVFSVVPVWLVVSYIYFIMPAGLAMKTVPCVAVSGFYLFLSAEGQGFASPIFFTMAFTFCAFNLTGIVAAARTARLRRDAWRYRRSMEDQLRCKRLLVDNIYEGLALGAEGRLEYWNAPFLEMARSVGLDEETLPGFPMDALFAERSGGAALLRGPKGELPVALRERAAREDGRAYTVAQVHDRTEELGKSMMEARRAGGVESAGEKLAALPLTGRERDIVACIVEGNSRNVIAEKLFISEETVKKHAQNIYRKLGIGSRLDLFTLLYGELGSEDRRRGHGPLILSPPAPAARKLGGAGKA